ncbi:UxaA family hydrolase [Sporomusa termitida]|uniref:Galactarate dehydratase (L-threo-forming) n=1 Tax=Sporomusa termitida TaxID=2377 RepID=A0A517DV96_9FIRM|nr:altronate dehydratase family protein [Sporomusa termitida]QDR81237.1 Galactarate dehydratase (L-threo-forming) [Sporomusa termitida]
MAIQSGRKLISPVIRLDAKDNVVVARTVIPAGTVIPNEKITTLSEVPSGYKIATVPIHKGEPILKYNTVIGFAAVDLTPGTMLHDHNIEFHEYQRDYAFCRDYRPLEMIPENERATFQGIVRKDGRVATRNYIGVIAISNCAATVVNKVADYFTEERLAEFANVNGVVQLSHDQGCGGDSTAGPMAVLRRTLGGYVRHPNFAGMVIVGLGCERNLMEDFLKAENIQPGPNVRTLIMQEIGGTRKTIEAGIAAVKEMLPDANKARRQTVPASHITIGLQCGGSDGFSGLSANPSLGAAMDLLTRNGGTAILSETSEIYGLEQTLTCRAVSREVGEKLVARMRWWKEEYCVGRDMQINGRVSPGNNKGGLANVFEKSLGGVKKGGSGPLMAVYEYAQPVTQKGLVFMDTTGYDPASATGQIAGGANMIVFTTGRGSCFGSVPSPTMKLASNTPMYMRMEEDMDMNCGIVIDGEVNVQEMGQKIFDQILRVASGEKTKSEELGVGRAEFVPWRLTLMG